MVALRTYFLKDSRIDTVHDSRTSMFNKCASTQQNTVQ